MHDMIIEAHGLKRYYQRGSETVKALGRRRCLDSRGRDRVDSGSIGLGKDDADQSAILPRRADGRNADRGREVGRGALVKTNWWRFDAAFLASSSSSSRCFRR